MDTSSQADKPAPHTRNNFSMCSAQYRDEKDTTTTKKEAFKCQYTYYSQQ